MTKKVIVLGLLFCFFFSFNVQAKNIWDMAESSNYGEKAGGMLARGLLNAATCFVDIPVSTVNGAKNNKPEFIGAVGGFATGSVCTILRAASGVIDVATFWIPGFNGIPVSRNYGNCLEVQTATESGYVPPTSVYEPAPIAAPASGRSQYVKK